MQHLHYRRHHHHHHHHSKNKPETRSGILRKIILRDYMCAFVILLPTREPFIKNGHDKYIIVKFFWKRVLVLFFNIRIYMKIYFYARTHTLFLSYERRKKYVEKKIFRLHHISYNSTCLLLTREVYRFF